MSLASLGGLDPLLGCPVKRPEKPPHFPMKFREFLRRALGGRLHAERLRFFRKFLVSIFFAPCDDPEAVSMEMIGKLSQNGINDPDSYFTFMREIKEWRPKNKIQQCRNAANSRWAKEKSKKSIDSSEISGK
jgi:hypothetical protein